MSSMRSESSAAITLPSSLSDPIERHLFARLNTEQQPLVRSLYNSIKDLPFIDIHTHYSELEVSTNRRYASPTEFFLGTYGAREGRWSSPFDHYLGNLLRRQGCSEEVIYGKKLQDGRSDPDFDAHRFTQIIAALSKERLHPVRLWVEITLFHILKIDTPISPDHANQLWSEVSNKLSEERFRARTLLESGNVIAACTTDSPSADLAIHKEHNQSDKIPRLLPTFRPDGALISPRVSVRSFIEEIERASGQSITTTQHLLAALDTRMAFFAERSCRSMDIGFDNFYDQESSASELDHIFSLLVGEKPLTSLQSAQWKTFMLRELCAMASARGWIIYLHQGPSRDTNSRLKDRYGFDAGGDAQGARLDNLAFQRFLDHLTCRGCAPKIILFPINSADWEPTLISMAPFQHDQAGFAAPLQLGPPWWFNDTAEGITMWLNLLKQHGSYRDSVGMLSDSRVLHTVLSRNLLFRAVLAQWLVENSAGASGDELYKEAVAMCEGNARQMLGV